MTSTRKMLGNRRVTGLEQCYTPPEVADRVIDVVERHVRSWRERGWLEPCGGTGTFLDTLAQRGVTDIHSVDVTPLHPLVREADFLTAPLPTGAGMITATNPPFGRNNALSIPFFNRAAQISDYIAFIVPRSWRKWSVINRLHPLFHLIADEDLQIDYLNAEGQRLYVRNNLRTCIQLWERRQEARPHYGAVDRGYIQKCGPGDADVALTIFGRGCGTVRTAFPRVPNTTQLYLRTRDATVLHALQHLDYSRFFNSVAYTEALSIREIWCLLNEYFDSRPLQPRGVHAASR